MKEIIIIKIFWGGQLSTRLHHYYFPSLAHNWQNKKKILNVNDLVVFAKLSSHATTIGGHQIMMIQVINLLFGPVRVCHFGSSRSIIISTKWAKNLEKPQGAYLLSRVGVETLERKNFSYFYFMETANDNNGYHYHSHNLFD